MKDEKTTKVSEKDNKTSHVDVIAEPDEMEAQAAMVRDLLTAGGVVAVRFNKKYCTPAKSHWDR